MIFKSIFPRVKCPDISIYEYVIPSLDKDPNKIQLVDVVTGDYLTCNQVKNAIHRISSGLLKRGFNKGDVLVLFTHNCIEYVLNFYAVLAIGGVVCLINPQSTLDELIPKLENFDPRKLFIFSNKANIPKVNLATKKLGSFKGYFVLEEETVNGFEPFSRLMNDTNSLFSGQVPVDGNDTAMILFSSGTTSKPKGVMLTHRNFVSTLHIRASQLTLLPNVDYPLVSLGVLPFFHIIGVYVYIGMHILQGAMCLIMPRFEPHLFLSSIQKYKVTSLTLVPALVYFMAKSPLIDKYDLSSLKSIGFGGAPVNWDVAEQLQKKLNILIAQGYALTENTGMAFTTLQGLSSRGSVGHLAPEMEAKIIEEETGVSLGTNKIGEVYIRGPNRMKGYLNNVEDTKKTIDDEGWLHTGDIGYFDDKNSLFIVDRAKELIKYKAFQVAPAELESILMNHPGVQDAAVSSIPDEEAGELPKAYIVRKNPYLTEQEIINFVHAKVAQHMRLRGGVEFIQVIPRTDSGKILRRKLKTQAAASLKAKL